MRLSCILVIFGCILSHSSIPLVCATLLFSCLAVDRCVVCVEFLTRYVISIAFVYILICCGSSQVDDEFGLLGVSSCIYFVPGIYLFLPQRTDKK